MIEIIQFKKEHAIELFNTDLREQDMGEFNDIIRFATVWEKEGVGYTMLADGKIVFCGGIIDIGWKRGEAWSFMGNLFYKYPKSCYKVCRNKLGEIIKEKGYRRIQALVDIDMYGGENFVKHLGFEKEGLLKSYGPDGEDMLMYSKCEV